MNKKTALGFSLLVGAGLVFVGATRSAATGDPKIPSETTHIVRAANAFLAKLSEDERKKEVFAFDDEAQRARWSNFPTGFVRRAGLNLQQMTMPQRAAVMSLLAAALSKRGYEKVQEIMEADEVLKQSSGERDQTMFGKELYYISILGTPSETNPWILQFGGHHLAINMTIAGEQGILTPTLTGAQPAQYEKGGRIIRPLAEESDRGLALLKSLSDEQRKKAILSYRVADLVLGPGHDGQTIVPEGLKATDMTEAQRTLLLNTIAAWSGLINDAAAKARTKEIQVGIDDTYFAWSGSTTAAPGHNITGYYRIQGPKLVIEYAPQSLGGDLSMHVHTIYRDPTNDYGHGLTRK